jgi:carbamoyltransferase
MYILGINAYHADAAACLLRDGELVAAAEEERFTRVKHCGGFPANAIRYCLAEGQVDLCDIGHIAINQDDGAHRWRKLAYVLRSRPEAGLIASRLRNRRSRANVRDELARTVPLGKFAGAVHHVEHHLSHLASAYFASAFDNAVAVSIDGFGDFASAAWGCGAGSRLDVDGRVFFPHSLGIFYQALTQYLGFPHYGDEYKVMGLAPFGNPRFMAQMEDIVELDTGGAYRLNLDYFRHHRVRVNYGWEDGGAASELYAPRLQALLGPARRGHDAIEQRHCDLAASVQTMYERALFHLLRALHAKYDCSALTLAGGCAQNSVANGKICRETPFRRLYVQVAGGDAGGALGAALATWNRLASSSRATGRSAMDHAYWGPAFSSTEFEQALKARDGELRRAQCRWTRIEDEDALCREVAAAIADGQVVGWFQGRMEWGPRALGNRSVLADPRRADMKQVLNLKIKRRESFRPFAPSILREAVRDWFDVDGDVPCMTEVYPVRSDKGHLIPAVTHVDGTGRLQTVCAQSNPRYYRLIAAFGDLTGVPVVLNTSFNENEPVVCAPAEALDCFLRTGMDMLVLGDHVIRRSAGEPPKA